MQTKLFKALKQTYASLGLSETILRGQAASLEATGLVTDENLDTVVSAQKQFLETLQSGIDKRVADALAKTNGSRQRKTNGNRAVNRHELQQLIEEIVGEKITSLQKQLNNNTKGECESIPAYSVRPLAKERGTSAWPAKRGFPTTHPGNDRMVRNYMSGARHTNAVADGLSDKSSRRADRYKPVYHETSEDVADDGYHVLHITEKMIHSEFRKVLMNLISAYE
ncbi:MAG: hypothetical protein LBV72_19815 [Tannerella sp.]|jgi:hypothetical protein|nr:hypothetical protein [Tannerella sp.]